jgi:cell wall-associated NlpC family hydrolase
LALSGYRRALVGALSAMVLIVVSGLVLTGAAQADPAPPPPPPNGPHAATAADAAAQLNTAQRDAEALTEQWHAAQDNLQDRKTDARRAQAQVEPARVAAIRAQRAMATFRTQIDQLTSQALEGGRLDQLNALVLSHSPSDFLDQMTTLDTFSTQQAAELDHAVAMVRAAEQAQRNVGEVVVRAQRATVEATRAAQQIGVRKRQADVRIRQVQGLLSQLTPSQRAARIVDDGVPAGVFLGGGGGKGVLALKAAMTRFDSPYVWGATGPGTFDCSGLVYWAFKRVGITLPRSSAAQSQVGRPVAKNDLRPGDLIFFYRPVSHVGIYAGDGKVLNAVQSGDVVRYTDLSKMHNYSGARRL